ncbi:MAG: DedA family protein [Deltaproteobacteria bacterium]|nr:DedA family protein [Deltaproteobacteria bacterium]MBZ0219464.1 DedA family protein [Deltaproteobacteria bacterium]
MELLKEFIDMFMHIDKHLGTVIQAYGGWTYLILFLIIFCETGLVVTPLLPGDSLLFAIGTFAAMGYLEVEYVIAGLTVAAIAGDSVNYAIGHYLGPRVFSKKDSLVFRKEYLDKTQRFYQKYGARTIVIARFVPIVRTFAPFVAGVGAMSYGRFLFYNVTGAVAWIFLFILGGYYFGSIPLVKENFSLVILAIIVLSIMPGLIEFVRARRQPA